MRTLHRAMMGVMMVAILAVAAAALPFAEEGGAALGLPSTDVARSSAGEAGAGGWAPAAAACVGSVRLGAEGMRMTWAKVA